MQKSTYLDWDKFVGDSIPSSLNTYKLLYDKTNTNQRILDIGCGYGKTCFELLRNGYKNVTGIDINKKGIDFAINKLKDLPSKLTNRTNFKVDDALASTLDSNQFDVGIMQAFLTTITTHEHRKQVLKEARRLINPYGGLYLAVFIQTWHSDKYRKKYETGEKETSECGSFFAYDKVTGKKQYQAHHYTEKELVYLLKNAGFEINSFSYDVFTTRSGNRVNGAVIWAT